MPGNTLYYGDNLNVLREHISDNSVDLIYLDPPFQSGKNYNVLFEEKNGSKSKAQIKAFEDTWHWDITAEETYQEILESKKCSVKLIELIQGLRQFLGTNDMMAYLVMMAIRLTELHRILKDTGSIYLHCDPRANHYLKLVLDAIFGVKNFRNEIVWSYKTGGVAKRNFAWKHDTILFFSKSKNYRFNTQYYKSYQLKKYNYSDKYPEHFDDEKKMWYHKAICRDVWEDIYVIGTENKERLGYPTQKPEVLLERIITASSNEGDIVLDPFCGCGTTVTVAQRLKRNWIGIDVTHLATYLIKRRLNDAIGSDVKYKVVGEPVDYNGAKALAEQDKYQFEWWVRGLIGARGPSEEKKKGTDKGIDGYIFFQDEPNATKVKKVIVQVKGGHIGPAQIRDLNGVITREKAEIGVFITLESPTKPMQKEAASAGFYKDALGKQYPKLQILTIKETLGGKKISCPPWTKNVTLKEAQRHTKDTGQSSFIDN